jgi:hypothetical protein
MWYHMGSFHKLYKVSPFAPKLNLTSISSILLNQRELSIRCLENAFCHVHKLLGDVNFRDPQIQIHSSTFLHFYTYYTYVYFKG